MSSPENPEIIETPADVAVVEAAPVPVEAVPAAAAPAPAAPAEGEFTWAADAAPKLVVQRGLKINVEYPVYGGLNFIGRADEKPVDIDLDDQEPPERVWSSRQHACITFENNLMQIEDLNSANGTYVNRQRIYPGSKMTVKPNDIIQVGTVQLKVKG